MPEKSSNPGGEDLYFIYILHLHSGFGISEILKSSHCVKLSMYCMPGMTLDTENTHPPSPTCLHKLHLFLITYRKK